MTERAPAKSDKKTAPKPNLGLLDSLVQLSFAVHAALERVAEKHELSLVQVRLLGILRDREPLMLELAKFLGLDKSSVTGLVSRAERRGLVQRTASPDDGRAVHVALTAAGRELMRGAVKQFERELSTLVGDMSEPDRKRLSELATQIVIGDSERRVPSAPLLPRSE